MLARARPRRLVDQPSSPSPRTPHPESLRLRRRPVSPMASRLPPRPSFAFCSCCFRSVNKISSSLTLLRVMQTLSLSRLAAEKKGKVPQFSYLSFLLVFELNFGVNTFPQISFSSSAEFFPPSSELLMNHSSHSVFPYPFMLLFYSASDLGNFRCCQLWHAQVYRTIACFCMDYAVFPAQLSEIRMLPLSMCLWRGRA